MTIAIYNKTMNVLGHVSGCIKRPLLHCYDLTNQIELNTYKQSRQKTTPIENLWSFKATSIVTISVVAIMAISTIALLCHECGHSLATQLLYSLDRPPPITCVPLLGCAVIVDPRHKLSPLADKLEMSLHTVNGVISAAGPIFSWGMLALYIKVAEFVKNTSPVLSARLALSSFLLALNGMFYVATSLILYRGLQIPFGDYAQVDQYLGISIYLQLVLELLVTWATCKSSKKILESAKNASDKLSRLEGPAPTSFNLEARANVLKDFNFYLDKFKTELAQLHGVPNQKTLRNRLKGDIKAQKKLIFNFEKSCRDYQKHVEKERKWLQKHNSSLNRWVKNFLFVSPIVIAGAMWWTLTTSYKEVYALVNEIVSTQKA